MRGLVWGYTGGKKTGLSLTRLVSAERVPGIMAPAILRKEDVMEKKEVKAPLVARQYQRELALRWPVKWLVAPGQQACRCVANKRRKRHEVWLTEAATAQPELFLADIVHELCHLHLAEQVDAVFGLVWFSEKWNQVGRADPARFSRMAQMFYLAWCQIDIWVNDLRHERWPALTAADLESFAESMAVLISRQSWEYLAEPTTLIGLAMYQAERERHTYDSADLFFALSACGIRIDEKIIKLADFFKSLPRLSYKARKDLKLVESSVAEVARRLEFPINPTLVLENELWVWDLG